MKHSEAEALRSEVQNWRWGIFYKCSQDPRLIVRNNFIVGWTWNFGHRYVFIGILSAAAFAIGIPFIIAASTNAGVMTILTTFYACILAIVVVANHIANGPR